MTETEPIDATSHERTEAPTADRLRESEVLRWPGTDGMTVDEVMLASGGGAAAAAEVSRGAEGTAAAPAPPAARE